jgi:hypothetical protein
MKKLFILIIFRLLTVNIAFNQSIGFDVVATAGNYLTNQSVSIDWTLGEPVNEFMLNNKNFVSNGFQQAFDLTDSYFITGFVHANEKLLTEGTVLMMDGTNSNMIDSMKISNGYFKFEQIQPGKYKLYAKPLGQEANRYYPTYYGNKLNFEAAYQIPLQTNIGDVDIYLVNMATSAPSLKNGSLSMLVYPNPVSETLYIQVDDIREGEAEICIYNMEGRIVYKDIQYFKNKVPVSINVQNFSQGIYTIMLKSTDHCILFKKISLRR